MKFKKFHSIEVTLDFIYHQKPGGILKIFQQMPSPYICQAQNIWKVITLGILITSAKTREQMSNISVYNCELIHLNKIGDRKGNITAVNNGKEIPFEIKRVFYLYDIPGGESRGAHAHKECHQFLVAASGSFEVLLDDGNTKRQVLLNRPDIGLHIPPGIWASEINFSSGSICLVLASHEYDELDYIRNYSNFLNEIK